MQWCGNAVAKWYQHHQAGKAYQQQSACKRQRDLARLSCNCSRRHLQHNIPRLAGNGQEVHQLQRAAFARLAKHLPGRAALGHGQLFWRQLPALAHQLWVGVVQNAQLRIRDEPQAFTRHRALQGCHQRLHQRAGGEVRAPEQHTQHCAAACCSCGRRKCKACLRSALAGKYKSLLRHALPRQVHGIQLARRESHARNVSLGIAEQRNTSSVKINELLEVRYCARAALEFCRPHLRVGRQQVRGLSHIKNQARSAGYKEWHAFGNVLCVAFHLCNHNAGGHIGRNAGNQQVQQRSAKQCGRHKREQDALLQAAGIWRSARDARVGPRNAQWHKQQLHGQAC